MVLMLFTPIFLINVIATQDESVDQSVNSIVHGEEIAEHDSKSVTDGHEKSVIAHN